MLSSQSICGITPASSMPTVKEPHFFADDLGGYPLIRPPDAYAALFADRSPCQLRIGEVSVYYLRSASAIPRIRALDPGAKIIAMFRNPVDLVHAHAQLHYVGEENVADFETAWRLQERGRRGLSRPPRCRAEFLSQYAELGRVGSQAERLLSRFPAGQVHLVLFEDLARSPRAVYEGVLEFLALPPDGRTEFPRINESERPRVAWRKALLRKPSPALRKGVVELKDYFGTSE